MDEYTRLMRQTIAHIMAKEFEQARQGINSLLELLPYLDPPASTARTFGVGIDGEGNATFSQSPADPAERLRWQVEQLSKLIST